MHGRRHHLRTGYLVAEVAIAFALLAALAVSLTVMVSKHNTAAEVLHDRRYAVRLAEAVLLSMQSTQVAAPADADAVITARDIEEAEPLLGWRWVEIHVERNGQTATLHGLVRTASLEDMPEVRP